MIQNKNGQLGKIKSESKFKNMLINIQRSQGDTIIASFFRAFYTKQTTYEMTGIWSLSVWD